MIAYRSVRTACHLVLCALLVGAVGCGSKNDDPVCTLSAIRLYGFPDGCFTPYHGDSPFNTRLPDNPRLMVNSSQIIARILGDISRRDQPANLVVHKDGSSGEPTYYSTERVPEFTLNCGINDPYGRQPANCPINGAKVGVPAKAMPEGNVFIDVTNPSHANRDAHMTIIDTATGWEYDLWRVQATSSIDPQTGGLSANGGHIDFAWGGKTHVVNGDGTSFDVTNQWTPRDDATAAHFASLAGRMRAEHMRLDVIPHALFIVIDCDNAQRVRPADGQGQPCAFVKSTDPNKKLSDPVFHNPNHPDNINAPPMGARLWLDMSPAQIDGLPVPDWKKALLRTMRAYGMFFGDTGTDFYFTLEQEAGNQYLPFMHNRWAEVAQQLGWQDTPANAGYPYDHYVGLLQNNNDGIDWTQQVWSHLKIVDPCFCSP